MAIKQRRLLNKFDTSGLQMIRVDFRNPECQKAVRKVVEYLVSNSEEFQLDAGETYQSVAEDLVVEVIKEERFIVSSVPINEIIFSAVLKNLDSIPSDDDDTKEENPIAENDREDALNYVESLKFEGSEKQIKWAKSIALNAIDDVVIALKNNKKIPTSAKWWIENKGNISL
ncbi:MAG: hypothetical protein ACK56B_12880 [Dolichospermum sp.]|jgi:hypothetical protein